MGCDGGLAFIPVNPKATLKEACNHLGPFFTFDAKGCDWGDDSRSDYLRENDVGHNIVVPYGTDISDDCLMADEVMDFVGFLERIAEKTAIQDLTFEDILIERDTRPSWDPPDCHDKKFYQAIEYSGLEKTRVSDWIHGLHEVLQFSKGYSRASKTVNVWRHETWT